MFTQIATVIEGFLSRGFWFGSFLPVALAAVTHAFLAHQVFPSFSPWTWLTATGSDAAKLPVVLGGTIVAAYALTPLLPWIRGMLDGSLLPGWIHDALRKEHAAAARKRRDQIGEAYLTHGQFQGLLKAWTEKLRRARFAGEQFVGPAVPQHVADALFSVLALRATLSAGTLPAQADVATTCGALEFALRTHDAMGNADLDRAHRALIKLLQDAELESRHRADSFAERNAAAVLRQPQATRMADAKRLTQQYCEEAYGVQFDYLWPRLQLELPDKGPVIDRLAANRAQGDFALLSLVLTASIAVVWLPMLAWHDPQPWLLCTLGIATPLGVAFFYRLALVNETAFGDLVKALVDRYRFDVLKDILRQPMPATLGAERELWIRLMRAQSRNLQGDLTYRHPPP